VLALAIAGCATVAVPVDPDVERAFYVQTVDGLEGRGQPVDPAHLDYQRFRQAAHLTRAGGQPADFTDAQAHLERARDLHFDDSRAATFHETVARGLLQSILDTGDGGERPWRVFDLREEEAVLAVLDLKVEGRSSSAKDGRTIDVVDCRDPRGSPRRLLFDVSPPRATKP
jgi:hypothetical protein